MNNIDIGHVQLGGKIGNNFAVDQILRIARTSDSELDGQHVVVLGRYADDGHCCSYIIQLERPYNGAKAIVLIESCLDRTSNNER